MARTDGPQFTEQMQLFSTPAEMVERMTASPDLQIVGDRFETMDELKSRKLAESKTVGNSPDAFGRPMTQSLYDSIKEKGLKIDNINLSTDMSGKTAVVDGQHRMIAGAAADKELGRETYIPWDKINRLTGGQWVDPGSALPRYEPAQAYRLSPPTPMESVV